MAKILFTNRTNPFYPACIPSTCIPSAYIPSACIPSTCIRFACIPSTCIPFTSLPSMMSLALFIPINARMRFSRINTKSKQLGRYV